MKGRTRGFTLVELMLVIAVIAILMTLVTGGVMRVIRNAREKRIDSMCTTLGLALMNYRGGEGRWPVGLPPEPGRDTVTFKEEKNAEVFADLIKEGGYLSTAEYLTKVNGRVMSLREAVNQGRTSVPLGYPNPRNTSMFHFFNVEFNIITDSVSVQRSH